MKIYENGHYNGQWSVKYKGTIGKNWIQYLGNLN